MAYRTVDTASADLLETHSLSSADTLIAESWHVSNSPTSTTTKSSVRSPCLSKIYTRLRNYWTDSWLTEIFSLVLSNALLAYMLNGLFFMEGMPIPSSGDELSTNTWVVILSTSCRALMLVPVLTGLAQLRWVFARRGSSLLEFQLLEQPSRGLFGALSALFASRNLAATLGPAIVLVSQAFEAFMQQALEIATPTAVPVIYNMDLTQSDVLISSNYLSYSVRPLDPTYGTLSTAIASLDPLTEASFYYHADSSCIDQFGVNPPASAILAPDLMSGPPTSSYATWDFCVQCSSATAALNKKPLGNNGSGDWDYYWSLPSGTTLGGSDTFFIINASSPKTDLDGSIQDLTVIKLDAVGYVLDTGPPGDAEFVPAFLPIAVAQECIVTMCTSTYDIHYNGTAFVERRRAQDQNAGLKFENGPSLSYTELKVAGEQVTASMTITNTSVEVLTYLFSNYLNGSLISFENLTTPFQEKRAEPAWKMLYSALHLNRTSLKNQTIVSEPYMICNDFETSLNILLRTVMNEIRQLYGTLVPLVKTDGNVYDLTLPFYRIRWAWVAFPLVLEAISTAYFLAIVVATERAKLPLWKNASLAVMYHGIDPTHHEVGMAAEKISEMDAVAKRTKVRLAYTKLGYRLVGIEEDV